MRKLVSAFFVCAFASASAAADPVPVRIGWQTSWATQGQMAMVLKKTNILELNGLQGEFRGFTYGGPLNEGALAGELDVIFTADQPACMLLAKGAKWKIVGRLIYNRVGTIVPPESPVKKMADLKGKVVGIPFGAAAQRETLKALKKAGLDPARDLKIQNIGIYEQVAVIQKGDNAAWPGVDAFSTWDPPLAELALAGKARVLDQGLVTAVIVMSEDFMKKNPGAAETFLKSYMTAYHYYAGHQQQANEWFRAEARMEAGPEVLDLAASVEPNLKAKTLKAVNIGLSARDIQNIQSGADFIYDQKLTKNHITVKKHIDLGPLRRAEKALAAEGKDYPAKVKVR
jgi:ABC-type nitrate/sulfonate/bicarbonate transport system substrate-binding protein